MHPPLSVSQGFGRVLREARVQKEMTQQQLADACGLDISYVGQVERGQRNPTLGVMHGLATVLGVKLSDLFRQAKL
jgi:transcriptional regulator with XRE-family HTH domain